ncbi:TPM domain-containing protein [Pedobacter changchengzhani]|uniref:TPM domain-containing protein n=1 Tax=Pedobacter changchengzhani TaxID=2529274 RepID=A0A4R5MQZ9_9SPHI|nr:TPM domain-containing protein [Pedobacter changchengzhani]TDG37945.1 TPM domain-containing protein [Pedobacter changchengzhani]
MSLFSASDQDRIANAIADAEQATSGEIRIAIDKHCKTDPYDKALEYFAKLGMDKTAKRNGVLIYLAHIDQKFAILGDAGINKVVPNDFWEMTKVAMSAHFQNGNLADGIIAGVALAGEKLALFFPYEAGDINELPNDIIYLDQQENK